MIKKFILISLPTIACLYLVVTQLTSKIKELHVRSSNYPVNSLILNRWSPRAFSHQPLTETEIKTLFDAARWAPSSYNSQPWRFVYATKNSAQWDSFLDLLVPFNQSWAKEASMLVVVCSRTTFEFNGKPAATHSFDTGSAWQNLALQAADMGIAAHGMAGFDYEKAAALIKLPADHEVQMMIAIGHPGKKEDLSPELQKTEVVSDRKALAEIMREGSF
jgi:nitroreductase